ncbi:MAG: limonene 1,2-monooxygenase, partial [Actinomycetota bacterium]|nr:limonene 1,2-monooxygenase [Actinomycetota bacterium]
MGLLNIGATQSQDGFDALAHHWDVVRERAEHYGQPEPDRDKWRLVGLMHIAETKEQAYRDVEYAIEAWFRYFQKTAAFPQMAVEGGDVKEMIDFINEAGIGAIGTPDDARAQVQRLAEQSGGFGAMLLRARVGQPGGDPALLGAHRQNVVPHFQGTTWGGRSHAELTQAAKERAGLRRDEFAATQLSAVEHMTKKYA